MDFVKSLWTSSFIHFISHIAQKNGDYQLSAAVMGCVKEVGQTSTCPDNVALPLMLQIQTFYGYGSPLWNNRQDRKKIIIKA